MKKSIAIIGATDTMGTAVAKELVTGPYHLLLLSNNGECLTHLLNELNTIMPGNDAEAVNCMVDACWEADLIILGTQLAEENETVARLREVATGKTVISILETEIDSTLPELKKLLPYSKVIRALSAPLREAPYVPVIDGRPVRAFIDTLQ